MYSCSSLKSWAKSEGCCEHGMGCGAGELVPCSPLGLPLILLPLWGSAQQTILLSCEHARCFSPSTALLFTQLSLLHPVILQIFVENSGLLLPPCLFLLVAEGEEAGYGFLSPVRRLESSLPGARLLTLGKSCNICESTSLSVNTDTMYISQRLME